MKPGFGLLRVLDKQVSGYHELVVDFFRDESDGKFANLLGQPLKFFGLVLDSDQLQLIKKCFALLLGERIGFLFFGQFDDLVGVLLEFDRRLAKSSVNLLSSLRSGFLVRTNPMYRALLSSFRVESVFLTAS